MCTSPSNAPLSIDLSDTADRYLSLISSGLLACSFGTMLRLSYSDLQRIASDYLHALKFLFVEVSGIALQSALTRQMTTKGSFQACFAAFPSMHAQIIVQIMP